MNILITGSKGQLGSEFQTIQSQFPEGNFFFTDLPDLDISDKDSVQEHVDRQQIDVLVNCAAYTAVDKAESDAANAWKVNHLAVQTLAEVARAANVLLVHISTDYVFNGTGHTPCKESDATDPQGVYGQSKWEGEEAIRRINPSHFIIRTAWLYSAFGNNFVKTMQRLGREKDALNVIADQVGTPTYARDLAAAIITILSKVEKEKHYAETYHFSNEGVCSWYDFADAIMEMSGLDCQTNPIETHEYPTPAKRPAYSVLNKSKIKNDWGIAIPHWRKSLKECIKELGN